MENTVPMNQMEETPAAAPFAKRSGSAGKAAGSPDSAAIARRLTAVGVGGNVALSAFKLAAGVLGSSAAMISDAIHSLSDVLATAIAYVGVKAASREADESHPYGHEKLECLASLALGMVLAVVGCGIGWSGAQTVYAVAAGQPVELAEPSMVALMGAVVSIVSKEAMYRYTCHWAKVMQSPAFLADANHHRSDALSSVGALVGIGASLAGFALGDSLASVVICVFILKMAWEVAADAVNRMVDAPCSKEDEEAMRACVLGQPGVCGLDMLRTRMFGAKAYVDVEIAVDGTLSLYEAHSIAEQVHDQLEAGFPQVKHVMVHVNPA